LIFESGLIYHLGRRDFKNNLIIYTILLIKKIQWLLNDYPPFDFSSSECCDNTEYNMVYCLRVVLLVLVNDTPFGCWTSLALGMFLRWIRTSNHSCFVDIHRPSVKFCKNVVPKSVRIRHCPWVNMGAALVHVTCSSWAQCDECKRVNGRLVKIKIVGDIIDSVKPENQKEWLETFLSKISIFASARRSPLEEIRII
jgi:hypothetical protein